METGSAPCQHCQKPFDFLSNSSNNFNFCGFCKKDVEKPKEVTLVSPCKIRMKSEWAHCQPKDLIYEKIDNTLEIQELNDDKDDSNSGDMLIDTDKEDDESELEIMEIHKKVDIIPESLPPGIKETDPSQNNDFNHIISKHKVHPKSSKKSGTAYVLYTCTICLKEFTSNSQRSIHKYCSKELQKPFKCFCGKEFVRQSMLKDHEASHSKTNEFKCKTCDKSYKRKSSLRKHEYSHKGQYKYTCEYCDLPFIDKVKYQIHLNNHESLTPFQCLLCDKSFAAKGYLQKHQVLHSDEAKYQCTKCDQKFKWATSLQLHLTIHNQNKDLFECRHCTKRFFNQRALDRHENIHSNLRYKCINCPDVMSVRRDNILRHIRQIHHEIPASEISSAIKVIQREKDSSISNTVVVVEPSNNWNEPEPEIAIETIEIDDPDIQEMDEEVVESPPLINNRVNVIQFVGKPRQDPEFRIDPEIVEIIEDPPADLEIISKEPLTIEDSRKSPMFLNLPPVKPKYNPIQHYRKMLLLSNDDDADHQQQEETETQDDHHPVMHWRKRTQNNYLYKIN